jgi:hypothetical protein
MIGLANGLRAKGRFAQIKRRNGEMGTYTAHCLLQLYAASYRPRTGRSDWRRAVRKTVRRLAVRLRRVSRR